MPIQFYIPILKTRKKIDIFQWFCIADGKTTHSTHYTLFENH
eukprot:08080.XXX_137060_137185_1 [CDS] Oithona nana genome sequencing.